MLGRDLIMTGSEANPLVLSAGVTMISSIKAATDPIMLPLSLMVD